LPANVRPDLLTNAVADFERGSTRVGPGLTPKCETGLKSLVRERYSSSFGLFVKGEENS
jgi:hypothetical protein